MYGCLGEGPERFLVCDAWSATGINTCAWQNWNFVHEYFIINKLRVLLVNIIN